MHVHKQIRITMSETPRNNKMIMVSKDEAVFVDPNLKVN